jgi:DNA-binding transcriptional LysR family regulator
MEIDYWREFVVLAQTCNFQETAEILYSSQSTLSKHIQCIEAELGIPLFDRTTRKVKLSLQACEQSGFEPKIAFTDHERDNLLDLVIK